MGVLKPCEGSVAGPYSQFYSMCGFTPGHLLLLMLSDPNYCSELWRLSSDKYFKAIFGICAQAEFGVAPGVGYSGPYIIMERELTLNLNYYCWPCGAIFYCMF